jgi:hypothetical protein
MQYSYWEIKRFLILFLERRFSGKKEHDKRVTCKKLQELERRKLGTD